MPGEDSQPAGPFSQQKMRREAESSGCTAYFRVSKESATRLGSRGMPIYYFTRNPP